MFATKQNNKSSSHSSSVADKAKTPFIQPKLDFGKSGDKYEVEADRVADQIVANHQTSTTSFFSPNVNPIQRQADEELKQQEESLQEKPIATSITPIVQLQPEEELQQKKEDELQQKEDDDRLQRQALNGGEDSGDAPSIESNLNSSKGGGSPLPEKTRSEMEDGFGTDFGNVRVHTDSNAVEMSKNIGAQAFTHGNDIFFNKGKYNPDNNSGKHLLAHELTHTVQQGASVQQKVIQKVGEEENAFQPPKGVKPLSEENGKFSFKEGNYTTEFKNGDNKALKLPKISLPILKERNSKLFNPPFVVPEGRKTHQKENWKNAVNEPTIKHLDDKINEATASGGFSKVENVEDRTYFFKGKKNAGFRIFGKRQQLLELAKIPIWDKKNNPSTFQVDHVVEHQLGGKDDITNYELLEASANSSSGSSIAWEMNKRIKHAYDILNSDYYQNRSGKEKPNLPNPPERPNQYVNKFLEQKFTISFMSNDFKLKTNSDKSTPYWSASHIEKGQHFNVIKPLTGKELLKMGTEDDPAMFVSPTGGERLKIPKGNAYPVVNWLPRVDLKSRPDFENLTLNVDAYKASDKQKKSVTASYSDMTWYLDRLPDTYIFYVKKGKTIEKALSGSGGVFQSLRLPGMSPIRINSLELTENGFQGIGKVLPDVPFISKADIDIVIDGNGIRLRKLFGSEELSLPAPFKINNATLEVSFGTKGLGIEGLVNFGINNVGEGHIGAAASTSGGFELEGAFNFDSKLFDPAKIDVEYKNNIWTIGGTIGIPKGKINGVKKATITATYSENTFTAAGEAELDIPGIQKGTMEATYNDQGFSIGGDFKLKDDIPGIRGGKVRATVSKQNGEEGYSVAVSGTAQPSIPGINTSLTVSYENGALTIEGSAAYGRGMLSGTVQIGATNKSIGEDGQPTGNPDDTMRVYGGGSLTLQLTPWLAATAGVKFLENGEIEVTGRIGLPSTVNVFDRKSIDKNLFNIPTVEIPIFAIPLGPRSIGIVARITGGLDFSAGFGPGQLRKLYADVTYNPDHEEQTTISGHGEFAIPADAGLTLRGDLGLGVSVAIASLSGGIEIAGTLGLAGEALASVDVNWSPQTGLALDALGRITVNPKFKFDINAFARASLDLWLVSLSETWRYNLASFSWGPDIQFGIVFPVHYKEGEPFNMSFDDIQVIYPKINVVNMAKGLARDVKDKIFD